MTCPFKVGDKVVCVDDAPGSIPYGFTNGPLK